MASMKTTSQVIQEFKQKHNNPNLSYDKVIYTGSKNKVIITCAIHSDFPQSPNHHLSGKSCPECSKISAGEKHRYTQNQFIEKSIAIHNDKYDYSNTIFTTVHSPVDIHCNNCNTVFTQMARNHLEGYGCSHCSETGFNPLKEAILYYLRIDKDGQTAYKIGITNNTIKKRFGSDMKYITILKSEKMIGSEAFKKEQSILKDFKEFKWNGINLLKNGNTELFSKNIFS